VKLLVKRPKTGYFTALTGLGISLALTGYLAHVNKVSYHYFGWKNDVFIEYKIKPFYRATPYIIGILLAINYLDYT